MASIVTAPASATTSAISTWNGEAWQSVTAIYADDGADACITAGSFDSGTLTQALKATNFDFSNIPADATITGIIMRAEFYNAVSNAYMNGAKLLDTNRVDQGDNKASGAEFLTSTVTAVWSLGGSADLWGASVDVDVVKNANFGVMIGGMASGNNCDLFLDYVSLEVCYTVPSTTEINVSFVEM